MLLTTLVEQYRAYLKKSGTLAVTSQRNYYAHTRRFSKWAGTNATVLDLNTPAFRRYGLVISEQTPKSVNMAVSALKHWLKWIEREGYIIEAPTVDIEKPRTKQVVRQPLHDDVILQLFDACDRLPEGDYMQALSRAILSVFVFSGLRLSEVLDLTIKDVDLKDRVIRVHNGKGNKSREVYPCPEMFEDLKAYLKMRPLDCRHEFLFAWNVAYRINRDGVYHLFKKLKTVAKLPKDLIMSPHVLRHSYATRKVRNGTPLSVLQADLGHASLVTTAVYVKADSQMQRQFAHLGGLTQPAPETLPEEKAQEAKRANRPQQVPRPQRQDMRRTVR